MRFKQLVIEPTGNKGRLLSAHGFLKMDMVTIEVRAKVARKGVEIDHGHARRAHDRIGHGIIRLTISVKAVESHVRLVVNVFITGCSPDPD